MKAKNKIKNLENGRERALNMLQYSARTEYEVINKLLQDGYDQEIIDKIISFLKEYKIIDDCKYTKVYIQEKISVKSHKQLEYALQAKGIEKKLIKDLLANLGSDQTDTIRKLFSKKRVDWKEADEITKQKNAASLIRKGFPYDQVFRVIKELENPEISSCNRL